MDSARSFVRLWVLLSSLVLAYAWLDLRLSPRLQRETEYSMRPDWSQLPDLVHWGGRLFHHGELWLLAGNAAVLGGLAALAGRSLFRALRHPRKDAVERVSIVPGPVTTSLPPRRWSRRSEPR